MPGTGVSADSGLWRRCRALAWCIVLGLSGLAAPGARAGDCSPAVATAVSVQGTVESRRSDTAQWTAVVLDQSFCPGEMIRVQGQSRAAFYLSNGTLLRLDEHSAITLSPEEGGASTWLNLAEGIAHFISRIKQSFKVITPFVNAAVEGTEFVVAVAAQQADVTVFEGRVRAQNAQGEIVLASGESARAVAGRAPALRVVLRPRDAVQWALYYPPVTEYGPRDFGDVPAPWRERLRRSAESYQDGDVAAAVSAVQDLPEDLPGADAYVYRAALRLAVGGVEQARADLRRARELAPNNGDAPALQAVIALVNNAAAQALTLSRDAVAADPQAAAPRLALSYARQAQFDIPGALRAAQEAVARSPDPALAQARVAELYLAQGALGDAVTAAQQAVAANPKLGRAQSVLGFAYLTRLEPERAEQSFRGAIALDQADPLPRMGLGLALIRRGELAEGRRQIEFAAGLDPNRSLIRSYLGKAYYEERRDKLAASQLGMAKSLDPKDPTPWLYDALVKQSDNRPVEALHDLQTSITLNDNRAVYRSRLLLDEDGAARSADLARIYQDLGFDRAALLQGWASLNTDPGNDAAHRFLADAYANLPRYEVARVSELLQAQLLQPINIVPVSPQLAEADLAGQESAGVPLASLNEYSPLFVRDGTALRVSGTAGNRGTRGDELVLSGIQGRLSYSLGQFHNGSDGTRENNDLKQDVYDAFAQVNVTERFSAQVEYRQRKSDNGDLQQLFDPASFDVTLRDRVDAKTSRLGFHYAPSPAQDVLGSVIYSEIEDDQRAGLSDLANSHGTLAELQHIWRGVRMKSIAGLGYVGQHNKEQLSLALPDGSVFPLGDQLGNIDHRNAYLYTYLPVADAATLTLGLGYDAFDDKDEAQISSLKRNQLSPKAGVVWRITPATSLRLAAFRTMKRPLLANQTVEPTQVAGFNQFFDDGNATDAELYGIGLDHELSRDLAVGAEASRRRLVRHFFDLSLGAPGNEERKESVYRAYVYWTPRDSLGLSAEYRIEDFTRPLDPAKSNFVDPYDLTTHYLPLGLAYYHPDGLFLRWTSTFIRQDVNFGAAAEKGSSDFWISGLTAGYRLTKYRGLISLGIDNLFDKDFKFQSVNFGTGTALPPAYPPSRLIAMNIRLWFR